MKLKTSDALRPKMKGSAKAWIMWTLNVIICDDMQIRKKASKRHFEDKTVNGRAFATATKKELSPRVLRHRQQEIRFNKFILTMPLNFPLHTTVEIFPINSNIVSNRKSLITTSLLVTHETTFCDVANRRFFFCYELLIALFLDRTTFLLYFFCDVKNNQRH